MSTEQEERDRKIKQEEPDFSLADFLESHPPNQAVKITDLSDMKAYAPG